MHTYIDIYCERLEPGLWAEPLNALTNAAFIMAAALLLLCANKQRAIRYGPLILIGLICAIGIGSTLFHTYATLWAMMMDVLPILLFQISFIVLYTRHVMCWSRWSICILLIVFFITMAIAMGLPRTWLNGSLEYAPALIFVTGFGVYHARNAQCEKYGLLIAASVFLVSLMCRTIDGSMCEVLPVGTHFLWHICNAGVLYLSARAYIMQTSRAQN